MKKKIHNHTARRVHTIARISNQVTMRKKSHAASRRDDFTPKMNQVKVMKKSPVPSGKAHGIAR